MIHLIIALLVGNSLVSSFLALWTRLGRSSNPAIRSARMSPAFWIRIINRAISFYGEKIVFGFFLASCLFSIAVAMFLIGAVKGNSAIAGIGCIITVSLFVIFGTGIGATLGFFKPSIRPKYRTAIISTSFWLIVAGIGSMLFPMFFTAGGLTFWVFTILIVLLLIAASFVFNIEGKGPYKIACATIAILTLAVIVKISEPDVWSSCFDRGGVAKKSFVAHGRQIKAEHVSSWGTIQSNVSVLYTDSLEPVKTNLSRGEVVQVIGTTKEVITRNEIAFVKIVMRDSLGQFLSGQQYLIPQEYVKREDATFTPGQYEVASKSNLKYKLGLRGGEETRRIVFDSDTVSIEDLPVGYDWKVSGERYGDITGYNPQTGEQSNLIFNFSYGQCPASIKLFGKKGDVLYFTFTKV